MERKYQDQENEGKLKSTKIPSQKSHLLTHYYRIPYVIFPFSPSPNSLLQSFLHSPFSSIPRRSLLSFPTLLPLLLFPYPSNSLFHNCSASVFSFFHLPAHTSNTSSNIFFFFSSSPQLWHHSCLPIFFPSCPLSLFYLFPAPSFIHSFLYISH